MVHWVEGEYLFAEVRQLEFGWVYVELSAVEDGRICVNSVNLLHRRNMDINSRTPEIKRSHGEALVRIGEKLHESVIYSIFVTPFLYFAKALFDGEKEKILSYIPVVVDVSDFIGSLFALLLFAVGVGVYFKKKGYDLIEAANRESDT